MSNNHFPFDLSALILPIHVDGTLIESIREKHTVDGKRGLIPHISLVYPFVREHFEYDGAKDRLRKIFEKQFLIEISFISIEKDSDRKLLYLKPDSTKHIEQITAECYSVFGMETPVPFVHLTMAKINNPGKLDQIEIEIRRSIESLLPLKVKVSQAWFCAEYDRKWHVCDKLNFNNNTI